MGTTDNWFHANGSDVNFAALGKGNAGFLAYPRPYFTYGGVFHGRDYGVFGSSQLYYNRWPPVNEYSTRAGVMGTSPDATGVVGTSTLRPGVYGQIGELLTFPSGIRAGVFGIAQNQAGVIGWSNVWDAIEGFSYSGRGIYGRSYTQSGIEGHSGNQGPLLLNMATTAGVVGTSDAVPGVIGTSNASIGVIGFSNNVGIFGVTTNPNSFAGAFDGNVTITRTLTANVITASAKNAVVPFPDGTQRVLHCMESPGHWFEDFGTARLKGGRATVKLDGDFAKVIKAGDYHVFVTPEGDCGGLYVRGKRAASFEVRELNGGKSGVAFSYRIVGRRKDIKDHRRFAKFDTRLPLPASPPRPLRKPSATASGVRAFVAQVEREASAPIPKRAKKKGGRSRALPKPLRIRLPA